MAKEDEFRDANLTRALNNAMATLSNIVASEPEIAAEDFTDNLILNLMLTRGLKGDFTEEEFIDWVAWLGEHGWDRVVSARADPNLVKGHGQSTIN